MLRAIGVPGLDREQDRLRRPRAVALRRQRRHQGVVAFDDPRLAPDFDAPAGRVIDQEELRARVLGEVAEGDELPVADEIDEAERRFVEDAQESLPPAAVLDVRLALAARGREEHAGLLRDELSEFVRDAGGQPPRASRAA